MRYLPIFDELLHSDTVIILLAGAAAVLLAGLKKVTVGGCRRGLFISLSVYAVCEYLSYHVRSYMAALMMLFAGTAALGASLGFIIRAIRSKSSK